MGQKMKRVVNLLSLIISLLLTANNIVQVSWGDEDCPLKQGFFERLIGDCKQMGGAIACYQTCLARFPKARHGTCDYFDETRSKEKTIPFYCSCCIGYDSNEAEAFGKYMPLPPEEWIRSELPPSVLTEDFFHPCPESEGLTSRVVADCETIGKPNCIRTCEENFPNLHSAFCQGRYMEEIESYVSDCVCCHIAGSEILPDASEQTVPDFLGGNETADQLEETADLLGEEETTDQSKETDRR